MEWFDQQSAGTIGGILGTTIGIYGGLVGCLANYCITRNKKKLLYTLFITGFSAGVVLALVGLAALLTKQPYHVWYVFLLPGVIVTILFPAMIPVIRNRFTQNELRQMFAKDL